MTEVKNKLPFFVNVTLINYTFVLILLLIFKLVGLDYFGIDVNSKWFVEADAFLKQNNLILIITIIGQLLQLFLMTKVITENKQSKLLLILFTLFNVFSWDILFLLQIEQFYSLISMLIMTSYFCLISKNIKKSIINTITIFILQTILILIKAEQFLNTSFLMTFIMSIDFFILLLIIDEYNKGGNKKCLIFQVIDLFRGSCLVLWISLKKHLTLLRQSLLDNVEAFNKLSKQDKISMCIFIPLAFLYNIITLLIILFIGYLNGAVVECIFILSSFVINKNVFGKTFHFKTAKLCFIISNLVYYISIKIAPPMNVSILVPITIGIIIAFASSLLVKKFDTKLLRGMTGEDFDNVILKVAHPNSKEYSICYAFYVKRWSDIKIAMEYHYSVENVQKIKIRVKKKLKELND